MQCLTIKLDIKCEGGPHTLQYTYKYSFSIYRVVKVVKAYYPQQFLCLPSLLRSPALPIS